ncbi:hypothetical protein [Hominenteromicrobium sp.]|uniref:hypothetical protein n=1 Tax=Hominenteromicrobium sp. TaxID=3073581 RepID=UPI003AB579FC
MGGGVSGIFRFAKYEMSAAVFVKFSAYAESERNFALNARSAAHCEAISREPKVVILRAVRQIPLKKDHCHSTMVFLVRVVIQHFSKNTVISMVLGHPNSEITCIPPS